MSKYVRKSHNVSVLLYHLVCPIIYRRIVFNQKVDKTLKRVCLDISARYEIAFIEIGVDKDHAHFLVQSVPSNSPSEIAQLVKSITGREIFKRVPEIKKQLRGYFIFDLPVQLISLIPSNTLLIHIGLGIACVTNIRVNMKKGLIQHPMVMNGFIQGL